MAESFENLKAILDRLTPGQKFRILFALIATVGLIWGVSAYATRVRYEVLFDGVDPEESALIVEELKSRNVAYQVSAGGRVIEVPGSRIDELRMELAGEGLPRGGGVGFEIFDKPAFGLSDFVQNVNYRRALERELARSVQSLESVESARVHLALPPKSLFAGEEREPSASVVVKLSKRSGLSGDRVRAITHLVASGVEELDSSRVSVVDSEGRMLTDGDEDGTTLNASQLEAKHAIEARIENTLVAILEPIVGAGNVRARATVELETASIERIEERYDPDGAVVRSEQKNKMKANGGSGGGVPGTASNVPGGSPTGVRSGTTQDSQQSVTNFEINKTISTIDEPRGTLLRRSVAVVVDNVTRKASDSGDPAADDEAAETTSVPRTPEEMRKITALVRAAVGIDESRGDVLIVENFPFDDELDDSPADFEQGTDWVTLIGFFLRYLTVPLAVALIALFIVRPGIAALRSLRTHDAGGTGPVTVGELQARLGGVAALDSGGGSKLRQKLIEAAGEDPAAAALVVRGWLDREPAE